MRALAITLVAASCVLTACGGAGDSDGSSSAALTCGAKELKVSGSDKIDGKDLNLVLTVTGYGFVNKLGQDPGQVSATTATGDLLVEFNQLTADGQSSPARGHFKDGELSIGNCETGDFVSTLSADADGNGVHFTLRQLLNEPYCGGDVLAGGDLNGCVGFEP